MDLNNKIKIYNDVMKWCENNKEELTEQVKDTQKLNETIKKYFGNYMTGDMFDFIKAYIESNFDTNKFNNLLVSDEEIVEDNPDISKSQDKDKNNSVDYNHEFTDVFVRNNDEYEVDEFVISNGDIESLSEDDKLSLLLEQNNIKKINLINFLQKQESKEKIISSLKHTIDHRLSDEVSLAQNMIRDYFANSLGENLDQEKINRLNSVFNSVSVLYTLDEDLNDGTVGGNCLGKSLGDGTILINERLMRNPEKLMVVLLHEYGHGIAKNHYNNIGNSWSIDLEEGTQDLLLEDIINSTLEKNGDLDIRSKKLDSSILRNYHSSYDYEGAFQRTILYALSKRGIDKQALAEYELGNLDKYWELVLGKNYKEEIKDITFDGKVDNTKLLKKVYKYNKDCFEDVNRTSIYARRNWMIPLIELDQKENNIIENERENRDLEKEEITEEQKKSVEYFRFGKRTDRLKKLSNYQITLSDVKNTISSLSVKEVAAANQRLHEEEEEIDI